MELGSGSMDVDENGFSKILFNLSVQTAFRSENEDQILVGVGVENIVAIAMPDAV